MHLIADKLMTQLQHKISRGSSTRLFPTSISFLCLARSEVAWRYRSPGPMEMPFYTLGGHKLCEDCRFIILYVGLGSWRCTPLHSFFGHNNSYIYANIFRIEYFTRCKFFSIQRTLVDAVCKYSSNDAGHEVVTTEKFHDFNVNSKQMQ